jgi:cytochrome b561
MFASTLTGWALAGTFSTPLNKDAFGIPVPSILISKERATHQFFEHWHEYLSYALALLVVIHTLAALRHHLIKHTDVLRRMWFGTKRA